MRIGFALFIALHALIHLLGPVKAFGWARISQLKDPITPAVGALWLLAAVLLLAAAVGIALGGAWWWWLALPGTLLSQFVIAQSWDDAKYGTLANLVIAVPLLLLAGLTFLVGLGARSLPSTCTGKDVPMPYAANLERLAVPQVEDVVAFLLTLKD